MNEKITFPRLATLLADRSGRSKRFSEDFLREFFALISERLEAGDSVKVKGLGTFKLSRVEPRRSVDVTTGKPMEISGHSKVVFIPSKELAEAVNAPFEAFTAIEISDDADLSTLFTKDEIMLQESKEVGEEDRATKEEDSPTPVEIPAEEAYEPEPAEIQTEDHTEPVPATMPTEEGIDPKPADMPTEEENESEPTDTPTEEENEPVPAEMPTEEENEPIPAEMPTEEENGPIPAEMPTEEENEPEPDDTASEEELIEEYDGYEPQSRRKIWMKTLGIIFGAAIFALIATFAIWYVFATNDFNSRFNRTASNTTQQPAKGFVIGQTSTPADTASLTPVTEEDTATETQAIAEEPEVPTAPSDAIVYDTISTTRYLTTMAKSHYGNFNLWPYIYEENKAILGHPDRIRPGTPVVIPKLSKYGVDPTNSADIEKAKKMGVEIYARYGKKI